MGLAVRKLQLAQVDLIAGHSLLACNLHTDGGNITVGKVSQRELHGSPAIRLLACLGNREHHQGLGVILEAQDQGQVAQVVIRLLPSRTCRSVLYRLTVCFLPASRSP